MYVADDKAYSMDQVSDLVGESLTFSVMDTCVCVVSLTRLVLFSLFMSQDTGGTGISYLNIELR